MASPRFLEMLRCRGVDESATPYPGMIVPFNGENQVVLETSGLDLAVHNSVIKLQEFEGQELTTELLRGVRDALTKPDVDPQQRDAFMLRRRQVSIVRICSSATMTERAGGSAPARIRARMRARWSNSPTGSCC